MAGDPHLRLVRAVGLALLLVTAGCSRGESTSTRDTLPPGTAPVPTTSQSPVSSTTAAPTTEPPRTTTTAAPTTTASPTTTQTTKPSGSSAPSEGKPSKDAQLTWTAVRTGAHDNYDRVVYEFSGTGTPGWLVRPVAKPVGDPDEAAVKVDGVAYIEVQLRGLKAIPGPGEVKGNPVAGPAGAVRQVVRHAHFEGQTQTFIGLDRARPFQVSALDNPPRLVVDFPH